MTKRRLRLHAIFTTGVGCGKGRTCCLRSSGQPSDDALLFENRPESAPLCDAPGDCGTQTTVVRRRTVASASDMRCPTDRQDLAAQHEQAGLAVAKSGSPVHPRERGPTELPFSAGRSSRRLDDFIPPRRSLRLDARTTRQHRPCRHAWARQRREIPAGKEAHRSHRVRLPRALNPQLRANPRRISPPDPSRALDRPFPPSRKPTPTARPPHDLLEKGRGRTVGSPSGRLTGRGAANATPMPAESALDEQSRPRQRFRPVSAPLRRRIAVRATYWRNRPVVECALSGTSANKARKRIPSS